MLRIPCAEFAQFLPMNLHHFSSMLANQVDLVDYLSCLGFEPAKISRDDYWYCSPLRLENTPSFKVNRSRNIWYDFGIGQGGGVVAFGMQYHQCSIPHFLELLYRSFPFMPEGGQRPAVDVDPPQHKPGILIQHTCSLQAAYVLRYLEKRGISQEVGQRFCREVSFELYGKRYTTLGFPNQSGGYELRSHRMKISSSPKDITCLERRADLLAVFEGFFDFLSLESILDQGENLPKAFNALRKVVPAGERPSVLVLNSLSFFDRSLPLMEGYDKVLLFLDRDKAGKAKTTEALKRNRRFWDASCCFRPFKDLNEFLNSRHIRQRPAISLPVR